MIAPWSKLTGAKSKGWSSCGHSIVWRQRTQAQRIATLGFAHAYLLVLFAGHCAQRLAAPRSAYGASGDDREAIALARVVCRSERGAHIVLRLARAEAEALVRSDWALVSAIARRLLEVDLLTGVDIRTLVDTHDRERPSGCDCDPTTCRAALGARPVRRADVAAAALLVVAKLAGESDDQGLSSDMDRALDAVGQWRNIDRDALRTMWERVREEEITRLAWRPLGQRVKRPRDDGPRTTPIGSFRRSKGMRGGRAHRSPRCSSKISGPEPS
jgi:hypothetical protein